MQNINTDKKRRIIYIELSDYDPSNEYVANYADTKTIRLYRKLTKKTYGLRNALPTNLQST